MLVTAAIIEDNGRVLIARRAGDKHAGCWEFPGGKVEDGESPEACLARELHEEFTILAEIGPFFAKSEHGRLCLVAYNVTRYSGELTLMVHDELAWAAPDALTTYPLLPADIPIADAWIRRQSRD